MLVGGAIATAIVVDIYATRGQGTAFFLASQGAGAFEHNRASTEEGRQAQDKRSKDALANTFITAGSGWILNRSAQTVGILRTEVKQSIAGGGNPLSKSTTKVLGGMGDEVLTIKLEGRTLIIDENLSKNIASELQNLGYNVKLFPKGTVDTDILTYAKNNNAIVVTNNIKDFNNRGVTTFKVSENMKKASEVNNVVQAIQNVNKKAISNPDLIKKGNNVSLAENK